MDGHARDCFSSQIHKSGLEYVMQQYCEGSFMNTNVGSYFIVALKREFHKNNTDLSYCPNPTRF